jgi:hypothetical protein
MATTYRQQYQAVANDSAFVGRVLAAAVLQAVTIYGEVNTTPNHAARQAFAVKVMASPQTYQNQFAWVVASDPSIDPADPVGSATDGALFAKIGAKWDMLAGVVS